MIALLQHGRQLEVTSEAFVKRETNGLSMILPRGDASTNEPCEREQQPLLKTQPIPPVLVPDHHALYLACSSAPEQAIKAVYDHKPCEALEVDGFVRLVLAG